MPVDESVLDTLRLVPPKTIRNEKNLPFNLLDDRPRSRELAALDPRDSTHASLVYLERWTDTFLREDAGLPPSSFVYSEEARIRKWDLLRRLHEVTNSSEQYRGVSVESALWQAAGVDGAMRCDVFVSALMGAYRFERKMRMEGKLKRLYKCYEGAESNSADYRETIVGLRILADHKQIPRRSKELLMRYYQLWENEENGGISLSGALKLIGVAAESEEELKKTRGKFLKALKAIASSFNLKDNPSFLPRVVFMGVLEHDPSLVDEFKATLWSRVKNEMKMNYHGQQEEQAQGRFDYYDAKLKSKQAVKHFDYLLTKRTWKHWYQYYSYFLDIKIKSQTMLYKKAAGFISHWRQWSLEHPGLMQRKRISFVMGRIHLERRVFLRWKKFTQNNLRIVFACRRHTELWRRLSQGFSVLRFAWNMGTRRMALAHWHEYTVWVAAWEFAVKIDYKRTLYKFIRAWSGHTRERQAMYRREADARAQHQMIREMQDQIANDLEEFKREQEEERLRKEEEARQKRLQEKQSKAYWRKQRRLASKKMDTKYITMNQMEERRKRSQEKRQRLKELFEEKWKLKERELAIQARKQRELWLADKEVSKQRVEKSLKELKKQFNAPPSKDSMEREAQLNSLANVVLINIEIVLFQQGQLLKDWLLTFDVDGDGFLSHEEFKRVFGSLPQLQLSAQQIRSVIQTLDEDNDGMITIAEMEKQAALVEKYCGQFGSPWKTYVDPAQDLLCYHNIQLNEKVYDYQMTNKIFRQINVANLLAEAEYEARVQCRKLRDDDWIQTLHHFAASTIQNMYHQWKARKGLDQIRWKYQKVVQAQRRGKEIEAAKLLQAKWRGITTRRNLRPWIAKCFYKKADPITKQKYYENAYTLERTNHRPYIHRRFFPGISW